VWPLCGFAGFLENCAVLVFLVWFTYKLDTWVWVLCLYRFSANFPYKLVFSLLLNEKAELLPVAPKKKLHFIFLCHSPLLPNTSFGRTINSNISSNKATKIKQQIPTRRSYSSKS
jgi:hypothetical protein